MTSYYKNIAVITGTFNPITIAHINLGIKAIQHIPEVKVIYIPAKKEYLTTWKQMQEKEIFSENERIDMLSKALLPFGFFYDTCEIDGVVSGETYNTLHYLAIKYGINLKNLYFISGSDKLIEFHKWFKIESLFNEFKFLIIQRNNDDMESLIKNDNLLCRYKENIHLISTEKTYQNISSTMIRNILACGNKRDITSLVPPDIYSYLMKGYGNE